MIIGPNNIFIFITFLLLLLQIWMCRLSSTSFLQLVLPRQYYLLSQVLSIIATKVSLVFAFIISEQKIY